MDRPANWTQGVNGTAVTTVPGQNCPSNVSGPSLLDKQLVTAPFLSLVNQELRWIFLLHAYGFACLFFVLGFYTFLSVLHLRSLISSRPFMSTINIFLCLLGASRAACLFIDPYNLKETMPKVIGSIIWDIGFPCVTSAFCLVQLAFLQLTQLKFGPEKMQKESCLSLVITGHFFFVITSDVALPSHNCYMAKYVVQTVFLVWSILLYLTFLRAGYKIMHLLRTMPSSMLTRDNSNTRQKGIMQLAMLAPYSNLASSVTAALVPTLLSPKGNAQSGEPESGSADTKKESAEQTPRSPTETSAFPTVPEEESPAEKGGSEAEDEESAVVPCPDPEQPRTGERKECVAQPGSAVPEVYVRPPTPTPSTANLPIIMVSSPSRRSSVASSRRGSDVAPRSPRRNSECSVRFVNEGEDASASPASRRNIAEFSPRHCSPDLERRRSPDRMSRRHSENVTPTGSNRDLRRYSDFSHEKNRGSQFATKLRRNSDFGNRTPRRMLPPEEQQYRLPKVLDLSPSGSRRNSDTGFPSPRAESRKSSDVSFRRNSDLAEIKPLAINRCSSDVSIRTLDKSPTHYQGMSPKKPEIPEKSESDSDQPDCSEKAALMSEKPGKLREETVAEEQEEKVRTRKKNLSWKPEKEKGDVEDITAETNLLGGNENNAAGTEGRGGGNDFTLYSILNHIAYVNRAKSDTPLHILEANTAAVRRSQIRRVLNVTYATAILGIILCITDIGRIFGPYGLLAAVRVKHAAELTAEQIPRPWPWLIYQTFCRALELIMGCAMASITKQPSVSPRHQYLSTYPNYNARVKRASNPYM